MTAPLITIYMDVCCFNRPFDDQTQTRIRLEAEAILAILKCCSETQYQLLGSDVIDIELQRTKNIDRLNSIKLLMNIATSRVKLDSTIQERAQTLNNLGFKLFDALHLASAESAKVSVFLTTDDRLLRRASRDKSQITIEVFNPVDWAMEILG